MKKKLLGLFIILLLGALGAERAGLIALPFITPETTQTAQERPRFFGGRRYGGWLLPLFAVFGSYLMLRSMALALANGGIEWRGTFYSLQELRGFPRRRN